MTVYDSQTIWQKDFFHTDVNIAPLWGSLKQLVLFFLGSEYKCFISEVCTALSDDHFLQNICISFSRPGMKTRIPNLSPSKQKQNKTPAR